MDRILTLTMNPAIDKSAIVDHVVPERKLRCREPRYDPGGGGINVSRAVRHMGGESVAVYTAGGITGQLLDRLLAEEGLDRHAIRTDGLTRENLHIYEETTGQQYRFNMPGASLSEIEWRRCLDALATIEPVPAYVVLSGSLPGGVPADFFAHAARVSCERGARVILDTSGEPLRLAVEEGVFLIKPNLRELSQLAGTPSEQATDVEAEAREVIGRGKCGAVVVSVAAGGAMAVTADGIDRVLAPAVRAVSKVGAGDSMVAGIVLALARGRSLKEAVRYGVAAGTAAVMRAGTQLCRREDVERLYAAM